MADLSPGSTLPLPHFRNELELEDLLIDSIAWIPLCPRTPSTLPLGLLGLEYPTNSDR